MLDCLELLGEIIAIIPVPKGEVSFAIPFNVLVTSLPSSLIQYEGSNITLSDIMQMRGIIIDTYYNNIASNSIRMESGATVKESSKTVTAGTYYSTKISASSYADIDKIRSLVYDMQECECFDVFVVDALERVFLLRADEPCSAISVSASLPVYQKHSIDIEVVSVSGLIPVLFEQLA